MIPRARWLATIAASIAAGGAIQAIGAPLPWMIGPILVFAGANAAHAGLHVPRSFRHAGQLLVGAALGLYFTAPVLAQMLGLLGWIALATALSLGAGLLASRILMRIGRVDPVTAFFACTTGGAAEMANQAERHGARVDQVAASQVTRVLLVVLLLPLGFQLTGLHGHDAYYPVALPLQPWGLVALLLGSVLAGSLASRFGVPNGWLFGPLLLGAILTASGHALSSVPAWLVNLGQWLIGCSLGSRFTPEFFRGARRFLLGVLASGCVLILLCLGSASLVAWLSGIPWATMALATAPGGLAEMGLTAKLLKLGVPVVTAFHVVRLAIVVTTAGPCFRLLRRLRPPAHS
ncbi:AbrB family transcriptional regulator [Luteimonas marina]|uniref:AbrB family transcriptional regulator n=1 Tax=Luteimonas marina TaxID=488485 RepID=A0A5C5U536_9GAMM|nr:AbrB family transcriptional regulator [Luteimonas marina]TWT21453.1 AbrB family transcriptional regulator [Luteimonas marina]